MSFFVVELVAAALSACDEFGHGVVLGTKSPTVNVFIKKKKKILIDMHVTYFRNIVLSEITFRVFTKVLLKLLLVCSYHSATFNNVSAAVGF